MCIYSGILDHSFCEIVLINSWTSSIIPVDRMYITQKESIVPLIKGWSLPFRFKRFSWCSPRRLKKLTRGFRLTGTDSSRVDRQSEYVYSSVPCSFGVKGFLILLESGNMGQVLFENVFVLAPQPKIGRLRMFQQECDIIFNKSRYSFGFNGLVECMQVLSSNVRLPRLKSMQMIGTTRKSPDYIRPIVESGLSSFTGAQKDTFWLTIFCSSFGVSSFFFYYYCSFNSSISCVTTQKSTGQSIVSATMLPYPSSIWITLSLALCGLIWLLDIVFVVLGDGFEGFVALLISSIIQFNSSLDRSKIG